MSNLDKLTEKMSSTKLSWKSWFFLITIIIAAGWAANQGATVFLNIDLEWRISNLENLTEEIQRLTIEQVLNSSFYPMQKPYSFLVDKVGAYTTKQNGVTAKLEWWNIVSVEVLNACYGNLTEGSIFAKANDYNITDSGGGAGILANSNVDLFGEGYGTHFFTDEDISIIYINNQDNLRISGVRLEGSTTQTTFPNLGRGIRSGSSENITIDHCYIHNIGNTSLQSSGNTVYGISVTTGVNWKIHDNHFWDIESESINLYGTNEEPTRDILCSGNTHYNTKGGTAIYGTVYSVVVTDFIATDVWQGAWIEPSTQGATEAAPFDIEYSNFIINGTMENGIAIDETTDYGTVHNVLINNGIISRVPENSYAVLIVADSYDITVNLLRTHDLISPSIVVITGSHTAVTNLHVTASSCTDGYCFFQATGLTDSSIVGNHIQGTTFKAIHLTDVDSCEFNNFIDAGVGYYLTGDSDDNYISGGMIKGTTGLDINHANCNTTKVHGVDFSGCTTDVSDSGTGTIWGSNFDQDGNFDQGVEP